MLELFKAEFIRYRHWAIWGVILQLLALAYSAKLGPVLAPVDEGVLLMVIAICFAFGWIQMVLHKRKNHWAYLLQTPLKPSQIYLALAAAGITNILIAVPIAWIISVLGFDYFTDTIIDMRHYYLALFFAAIGIMTYLMGSLAVLSASRAAILTGVGLFFIFLKVPGPLWLVNGTILLIIGYLVLLNIASFKPDLSQPFTSRLRTFMLIAPMQMVIVGLLLLSTQLFYHAPRFILATHPSELVVAGTFDYWQQLPIDKRVGFLLKESDIADKTLLARQAELATSGAINIRPRQFGSKGQYPFIHGDFSLEDKENHNLWIFSHDEMLLQGVSLQTGKVIGWLGKSGFIDQINLAIEADRFDSVPFLLQDSFIATKSSLYLVDFEAKQLLIKAHLPDGEQMVGQPKLTKAYVSLVSHKQVHLFDLADLYAGTDIALPAYSLPYPKKRSQIDRVDTYAMVDGILLVYMGENYYGFDRPGAEIIYAKRDAETQSIYKSSFSKYNNPDLIRHFDYLVSPLVHTLEASINHSLRSPYQEHPIVKVFSGNMPVLVNVVAVILHIFSAGIVFWVSGLIRLNTKMVTFWVVMTGLIGIPGLLSFFFVNKVKGNIISKTDIPQWSVKPV